MSLGKTRRGKLGGAALLTVMALFEAGISRHAQLNHAVVPYKGSWFAPEAGYFVAICFFLMSAFLLLSAFRRSDEEK